MKFFLVIYILLSNLVFGDLYDWEVKRVVDGDTIELKVDFLPKELGDKLLLRIWGVDTPEKGWRASSEKEKELALKASEYTFNLIKNSKQIKIKLISWDKYGGRILGDLIIDGKSLRDLLLENGYAKPYFGDKKEVW